MKPNFLFLPAVLASGCLAQVKFMPLGDSITEITCWRAYVWDQFAEAGLSEQVDFVGSMNNNPQGCTTEAANFDTDHEGHSGWLSIDIADSYLEGWLASTTPDVVQFMLGTNDAFYGHAVEDIIDSYTRMVDQMRASNPNMQIIIDKLIPTTYSDAATTTIDSINAQIPDWAAGLSTDESPIQVADCSSEAGFTTAMLRDGIHPNDEGDQLIAAQVGPLVLQAAEAVLG